MSERKLTDEQIEKILEKQMIDTKQMAKHMLEEYSICYGEVDIEELAKYFDGIKAEAIKEFAERYAENFISLFNLNYGQAEAARELRKRIVKEMVDDAE